MPHLVVHCSESVTHLAAPEDIIDTVFEAAEESGLFATTGAGGIKVRLQPFRHYRNVEGREHFVHVFAYVMEGRGDEQKAALTSSVVGALSRLLPSVEIISMDVTEFERATYRNAELVRADDVAG